MLMQTRFEQSFVGVAALQEAATNAANLEFQTTSFSYRYTDIDIAIV